MKLSRPISIDWVEKRSQNRHIETKKKKLDEIVFRLGNIVLTFLDFSNNQTKGSDVLKKNETITTAKVKKAAKTEERRRGGQKNQQLFSVRG